MNELKLVRREVVHRGKVFDLIVDQVEYPSGNTAVREIAHHPGGAVVVPLLDDGRVLLIRQLRYPLGVHIFELPAGKLDPGEDPRACASRELREETGYVASRIEKLTTIYTTPGFCDEKLHIFLATQLAESPDGHQREEGELTMTVHPTPIEEAIAMVERGDINDAKTIVGLLLTEWKRRSQ